MITSIDLRCLQILSTELVYDCGQSLNPLVDVGQVCPLLMCARIPLSLTRYPQLMDLPRHQVEGAYMMGVGLFTTEDCVYDDKTGELLSLGTFEYKPPFALDIPQVMNVSFGVNAWLCRFSLSWRDSCQFNCCI